MKMNEVIRKYRKERGLTQEQVAGYLGVIYYYYKYINSK